MLLFYVGQNGYAYGANAKGAKGGGKTSPGDGGDDDGFLTGIEGTSGMNGNGGDAVPNGRGGGGGGGNHYQ